MAEQQFKISKFANMLPRFSNTIFFGDLLRSELYQGHLERIADYLICGEGVWWHKDDNSCSVVFHDSEDEPNWRREGPGLSHFRSSNIKGVAITVQQKWKLCLSGGIILPIKRLKKFDEEGNFQT